MSTAAVADPWHLFHAVLRIELDDARTIIDCESHVVRNSQAADDWITLDGRGLELLALRVDGRPLPTAEYEQTERTLRVQLGGADRSVLSYSVAVVPGSPAGEGFTRRPNLLSTNCEPLGFRRITWFLDRPSNRATFDVTLVGAPDRYPTMLCNGDRIDGGILEDGRSWVRFIDPISKPSYLFAVVAGELAGASSTYVTRTGRSIELKVVAPPHQIDGAGFALRTMAQVMAFDEANGAIEHDLDTLTFVAIPGYPDATEYHGLMFFESSVLLVDTRGWVDDDLFGIINNIAHEYGHHVRGNRVTVRSWGQLALKEGLTVMSQNDFRAHLLGPVGRVLDVFDLRRLQFPEEVTIGAPVVRDEGVDPHQLYTRTTYLKGAEVFRMVRTLLGPERWRAVFDEFVRRYDLSSAGVDDFIGVAGELAPGLRESIEGIARWFTLVGRPAVSVSTVSDATGDVTVSVQRTDTLGDEPGVALPVAFGFHDVDGAPLAVEVDDGPSAVSHMMVLSGRDRQLQVRATQPLIVSVLRGYSAPVDFSVDTASDHLAALISGDDDAFTRWWASEELMIRAIDAHRSGRSSDAAEEIGILADALGRLIDREPDTALLAQLLSLPDEFMLGDREARIDVDGVSSGLAYLRAQLGVALHDPLIDLLERHSDDAPSGMTAGDFAKRMLVEPCLDLVLASGSETAVRVAQQQLRSNASTRSIRALNQLAHLDTIDLDDLLAETRTRFEAAPRLLDRWLRAQTGSRRTDTIDRVRALVAGDLYDRTARSRVMALWFPFCTRNRSAFHDRSGAGYRLFVDEVGELMPINAAVVVRLVGDLLQFARFDDARSQLMRTELQRMVEMPGMPDFAVGMVRRLLDS